MVLKCSCGKISAVVLIIGFLVSTGHSEDVFVDGCSLNDYDLSNCQPKKDGYHLEGPIIIVLEQDIYFYDVFESYFKSLYNKALREYFGVDGEVQSRPGGRLRYNPTSLDNQEKETLKTLGFEEICGKVINYFKCPYDSDCNIGCGQKFDSFSECTRGCDYRDPTISEGDICKYNQWEECDHTTYQMQSISQEVMDKILENAECEIKRNEKIVKGEVEVRDGKFICVLPSGGISNLNYGDAVKFDFFGLVNQPPVILSLTVKPDSVSYDGNIEVSGSFFDSDGDSTIAELDFGDGEVITGWIGSIFSILHQYKNSGTYNVCLKVTDDKGASNKLCKSIKVDKKASIVKYWVSKNPAVIDRKYIADTTQPLGFPAPVNDLGGIGVLVSVKSENANAYLTLIVDRYISPSGKIYYPQEQKYTLGNLDIGKIGDGYLKLQPFTSPLKVGKWRAEIVLVEGGLFEKKHELDRITVNFDVVDKDGVLFEESNNDFFQKLGKIQYARGALSLTEGEYAMKEWIEKLIPLCKKKTGSSLCDFLISPSFSAYIKGKEKIYADIARSAFVDFSDEYVNGKHRININWQILFERTGQNYDRAIVEAVVPYEVNIIEVDDGGQIIEYPEKNTKHIFWTINGIDKLLVSYTYQEKSPVSFTVDDTQKITFPVTAGTMLLLGPYEDLDREDGFEKLSPWYYNYEKWQQNPEEMIWYHISSHRGGRTINNDRDVNELLFWGDGLPDSWEYKYFDNTDQWPDGDYDGDGLTNLEEWKQGTDPAKDNINYGNREPDVLIFSDDMEYTGKASQWSSRLWYWISYDGCNSEEFPSGKRVRKFGYYGGWCGYNKFNGNYLKTMRVDLSNEEKLKVEFNYFSDLEPEDRVSVKLNFKNEIVELGEITTSDGEWKVFEKIVDVPDGKTWFTLEFQLLFDKYGYIRDRKGFSLDDVKIFGGNNYDENFGEQISQDNINSEPVPIQESEPVIPINQKPIANAGEDMDVFTRTYVYPDGSKSYDPEGKGLTYTWKLISKPLGSYQQIYYTTRYNPRIYVDKEGEYILELIVSDGELVGTDKITITAKDKPVNKPPVSNAGEDQKVYLGDKFVLDGSKSYDPNGDSLRYYWKVASRPYRSYVNLDNYYVSNPSFTPDKTGTYQFDLRVYDGKYYSSYDRVVIEVSEKPIENNLVEGSGSCVADDQLVKEWTLSRSCQANVYSQCPCSLYDYCVWESPSTSKTRNCGLFEGWYWETSCTIKGYKKNVCEVNQTESNAEDKTGNSIDCSSITSYSICRNTQECIWSFFGGFCEDK